MIDRWIIVLDQFIFLHHQSSSILWKSIQNKGKESENVRISLHTVINLYMINQYTYYPFLLDVVCDG